jgi:hypothetical protein
MIAEAVELSKRVKVVNRKLIPLKRLKNAPHNPPGRVDKKNLRELMDSLDLIGLLHPVTVSASEEIIDGHRRCAAARLLGWQDIECNVVDEDAASVYASVNVTARRMSGNDALTVWLANPHAVTDRVSSRIGEMANVIGLPLLKKIADAGYSMRVYQTACRVCRYCEVNYNEGVKSVVQWLLSTATIGHVMKAMEAGESPKIIMEAVRKNKPVVFRLAVDD